ncbi:MAG: hypothetical protein LUO91_00520, partial [Methanomicrobiales archaeon]|nr:hypothetical protein [Methanomicrobiales archaeon]
MNGTRDRRPVLVAVTLVVLILAGVVPQTVGAAQQAKFNGLGPYRMIWSRYYSSSITAGIFKMQIQGSSALVDSYCIDLYKPIRIGNILLVDGDLSDAPGTVDWCRVAYILANYDYTRSYSSGHPLYGLNNMYDRAAAIQAAIWYVTTAPYGPYPTGGKYQYMSDPKTMTPRYDAYYASAPERIRNAATGIVNLLPAECDETFRYPDEIVLTPAAAQACTGQVLTATLTDQHGDPLAGVKVVFKTDLGSFNDNGIVTQMMVITDAAGHASVTLYDLLPGQTATVTVYATGNYGSFLYDPLDSRQTLTTIALIPTSVADTSQVSCTTVPPPVGLDISKTAETSLTRTYQWSIQKSVDIPVHDLYAGETGTSTYTVRVEKSILADSNWKVKGTITIHNPSATQAVLITGIADRIEKSGAPDIPVTISCK